MTKWVVPCLGAAVLLAQIAIVNGCSSSSTTSPITTGSGGSSATGQGGSSATGQGGSS